MQIRTESLIFITALLTVACNAGDVPAPTTQNRIQEKVETYGTGAVSRRYQLVDGKIEGVMTDYFPDGRIKAERRFENNKQTGRTVLYHPGGAIREVQYYENGLKEGGDTLFYETGRPEFIVHFQRGLKNGPLQKFSPEGVLVFEARYRLDTLEEVRGKSVR